MIASLSHQVSVLMKGSVDAGVANSGFRIVLVPQEEVEQDLCIHRAEACLRTLSVCSLHDDFTMIGNPQALFDTPGKIAPTLQDIVQQQNEIHTKIRLLVAGEMKDVCDLYYDPWSSNIVLRAIRDPVTWTDLIHKTVLEVTDQHVMQPGCHRLDLGGDIFILRVLPRQLQRLHAQGSASPTEAQASSMINVFPNTWLADLQDGEGIDCLHEDPG